MGSIDKDGILSKIVVLINWRRIEKILGDVHPDLGRTGYDDNYSNVFCCKTGIV